MAYRWRRYWLFRLRMILLYLPALVAMAYFRWIAAWFGAHHVARMRHGVPRTLASVFLWLNGVEVRVNGLQHLDPSFCGARILTVNHNSRFDGYILLATCPVPFKSFWSNTAHVTTEKFGLVQSYGRVFDLFFMHDKTDVRRTLAEFKKAEAYLGAGATLSFFPEGRFSADGRVRGIGSSCISLALRTHAQIVPIVLKGSELTFEKMATRQARVLVDMEILPPIATDGLSKRDIPDLVQQLEQTMNEVLEKQ